MSDLSSAVREWMATTTEPEFNRAISNIGIELNRMFYLASAPLGHRGLLPTILRSEYIGEFPLDPNGLCFLSASTAGPFLPMDRDGIQGWFRVPTSILLSSIPVEATQAYMSYAEVGANMLLEY